MRQRERDRLNRNEKVSLRQSPKQLVQKVVDDFNLGKWLAQEEAREKLVMAGYRGQAPYITFLFARRSRRSCFCSATAIYVFCLSNMQQPTMMKIGMCLGAPISACRRRCSS
jgi:tight adherence protein C